jgi:hypothetical protein
MKTARQVRLLAEVLDQQGKQDAPIAVIGTRAHLRREFPAPKRGAPLMCGCHELHLICREPPRAPLENLDWIAP